jgi:hypothetical protein
MQALPIIPRSAQTRLRLIHPWTGSRLTYRRSSGSPPDSVARKIPVTRHTVDAITSAALVRSRRSVTTAIATSTSAATIRMRAAR